MEKNESRIWVFDPANNTDHEAGGLRGKPITPPEWAENRGPGWASPDPEGSGPRRPRRVHAWMIAVAVIAVVAVVLAGLGVWQAVRVRGAVASCESMAAQATAAYEDLLKLVQSDELKDAKAITADQVEDPDTVTALQDALQNAGGTVSIGVCGVEWYDLHPDRIVEKPARGKTLFESKRQSVFRCSYTLSKVSACCFGWFGVVMVWIQRVARRSSSGRLRVPRSISLMRLEWTPRASPICCWVMPCATRSSRSRRPRSAGGLFRGVRPRRMETRAR